MLSFLRELLAAWREYLRYTRAVNYMRRTHFSMDLVIYALRKVAREPGQRVSIALETAGGRIVIATDTDRQSPELDLEDALYKNWQEAKANMGARG